MKKISKKDQKILAVWAADIAEGMLPSFEKARPNDKRPRKAIEACREWVRTGAFKMAVIRKASLDAHAAARDAEGNDSAFFAARAAGQSVATAHVPQHAYGPAFYKLKAVAAADPENANEKIQKEHERLLQKLPKRLRKGWLEWEKQRLPKRFKRALQGKLG